MSFDGIAPYFRWLEWAVYGRAMERRRCALLKSIPDCRRCLMLGEGDGRFLVRFLQSFPAAEVDIVESSQRMIELARYRLRAAGFGGENVRFHHQRAVEHELPPRQYDLVITNFFLDTLTDSEVRLLSAQIGQCMRERRWLVAEFQQVKRPALIRFASHLVLRGMYLFFRIAADLQVQMMPDYHPILRSAGLHLQLQESAVLGFLVSELWVGHETSKDLGSQDSS